MDPLSERLEALGGLEPPPELDLEVLGAMKARSERSLPVPIALGAVEGAAYIAVIAGYTVFALKSAALLLFG